MLYIIQILIFMIKLLRIEMIKGEGYVCQVQDRLEITKRNWTTL